MMDKQGDSSINKTPTNFNILCSDFVSESDYLTPLETNENKNLKVPDKNFIKKVKNFSEGSPQGELERLNVTLKNEAMSDKLPNPNKTDLDLNL